MEFSSHLTVRQCLGPNVHIFDGSPQPLQLLPHPGHHGGDFCSRLWPCGNALDCHCFGKVVNVVLLVFVNLCKKLCHRLRNICGSHVSLQRRDISISLGKSSPEYALKKTPPKYAPKRRPGRPNVKCAGQFHVPQKR